MKVLYIVTQADGGGAQRYVLSLAKHFKGLIAAGNSHPDLFTKAKKFGIESYPLKYMKRGINPYHDFLGVLELVNLIKKTNPDIVHLNSSKAGVLGSIAGKLCGKKVIFTAHGMFFFDNTAFWKRFLYTIAERFASLFRDHIIAVSNKDRNNALKYKIITPDKICTIYNGLPPINFIDRLTARKLLGINNEIVIGNVSQYYHRKGLDLLIQAYSRLDAKIMSTTKLLLIGDGPEKVNLQKLIKSLSLENNITLYGHLLDANKYIKALDIFALSSRVEGFPFVLIEALQAKLAIVATNVGGNTEAIQNSGIIVDSGNIDELTKNLEQLATQPELRERLSKETSEQSAKFSENTMLEQTRLVYQKIRPS